MVWFRRRHFPSPGTDSCICSRLFSVLSVWFWLGLQLRLELVLKVSGLGLGLGLVLVGLDVVWGWKIVPFVVYICQSETENNIKHLVLGFQVYYLAPQYLSELIQLLSDRLTSSTTFCIHGWSSGAGYAALNHRRPCIRRRQSTILEQSSSSSAPIPDIYYFQNTLEVTSVQLILSFILTVSLTIFVHSPWSRLCGIHLFKFVIITLHYITLYYTSGGASYRAKGLKPPSFCCSPSRILV